MELGKANVGKIVVPTDFGVEKLLCPIHGNVTFMAADGKEVKANSIILSYNSEVFENWFEEQLYSDMNLEDYSKENVDKFFRMLYSGSTGSELNIPGQVWELASIFEVHWLLRVLDTDYDTLLSGEMLRKTELPASSQTCKVPIPRLEEFPETSRAFDDAKHSAKRQKIYKPILPVLVDEDNSSGSSISDGESNIPNLLYKVPKEFEAVRFSLNSFKIFDDEAIMSEFDKVFTFANNSSCIKNLYIFFEFLFSTATDFGASVSLLWDLLDRIEDLKKRRGWRNVSKSFLEDLLIHGVNPKKERLLKMAIQSGDIISSNTSATKIVSDRGASAASRSHRSYCHYDPIIMEEFMYGPIKRYKFFWKHPKSKFCSLPGHCGFVVRVCPIAQTFDIHLSLDSADYSSDIHCHPDLLDSGSMHIVLRRDYSTASKKKSKRRESHLVYLTWNPRPRLSKASAVWVDQLIPDKAYVALIVYYSYSNDSEDSSTKS